MITFTGIDPGISGGVASIYPNGETDAIPMPMAGKEIDVQEVSDFLQRNLNWGTIIYIEKVGAFPGQGTVSMWKFGFVTGIIHGIVRTLGLPLYLVTPQAWKKEILAGTDKSKEAAIDWCRRVYPSVNLIPSGHRVAHSGCADALCIAEYGRRKFVVKS